MNEASIAIPYGTPQIRDHGRLSVLTTFDGGGLHFAQVTVGSLPGGGGEPTPAPVANPGITPPAQDVLDTTQSGLDTTQSGGSTPDAPDSTAVRDGDSSPSSAEGTNGVESGSNGGGVGSGSEDLPFTGMAVGPVAALGAGLAAAGATLRRRTRRP